jgi:hypothetical protein
MTHFEYIEKIIGKVIRRIWRVEITVSAHMVTVIDNVSICNSQIEFRTRDGYIVRGFTDRLFTDPDQQAAKDYMTSEVGMAEMVERIVGAL